VSARALDEALAGGERRYVVDRLSRAHLAALKALERIPEQDAPGRLRRAAGGDHETDSGHARKVYERSSLSRAHIVEKRPVDRPERLARAWPFPEATLESTCRMGEPRDGNFASVGGLVTPVPGTLDTFASTGHRHRCRHRAAGS
jgi:hypothetical protein